MVVREPIRVRKAALAGVVALALTGTGAALAWSATGAPTPTPSPSQSSQSAPGNSGNAPGHNKPGKAQRAQPLHGEEVVKNADGTFQTVLEQRGTVESVSGSAITVKSEDGFSQTYAINGDTKITRIPPAANPGATPNPEATPSPGATAGPGGKSDDGKRLKPSDGTIADIAVGDAVRIAGVKDGGNATAKRIVKGAGDKPGLGLGRGLEHAPGLKHAPGLGPGKGMNQGNGKDDQGA